METKQVIVIRKDLKMRRGKEIAQGAHASMAVLTKYLTKLDEGRWTFHPTKEIELWLDNSFTKVTVTVKSEEELMDIFAKASHAGLPCALIKDNGKTELKVPTYTAVAIGPAEVSKIDEVTGKLPLY